MNIPINNTPQHKIAYIAPIVSTLSFSPKERVLGSIPLNGTSTAGEAGKIPEQKIVI